MLFMGYGGLLANAMNSGSSKKVRILGSATSGIGLLLMLVAGFGLIARLYGNEFQTWMWIKFGIWVILGGLIILIKRKPSFAIPLWFLTLLLGLISILAVYLRPFA